MLEGVTGRFISMKLFQYDQTKLKRTSDAFKAFSANKRPRNHAMTGIHVTETLQAWVSARV